MSNNVVLESKNVYKKIASKVIINDLNLKLYEGDILGFIGSNGAGKTTSIKLLLGLQASNGGSIKICNYDLKSSFEHAIKNVGAIIENPDLYMYLTGYENLKIASKYYNISKERIDTVVKIVGLEKRIHDKVRKYSLGMRQRLGIAEAILHKPKILILDEPMNGLDPEGINDLKKILTYLANKEKMAIFISSHILSELETICNRICILSKEKILKDESIETIKNITNKNTYLLELSKIPEENLLTNYQIIKDNIIKITTTKENLNNIIKLLLLNEISIYEIKKETKSLEEFFLELSKSN